MYEKISLGPAIAAQFYMFHCAVLEMLWAAFKFKNGFREKVCQHPHNKFHRS
jgi:hypothetical protein